MNFNLMFNSFILGAIGGAIFGLTCEILKDNLIPMYHKLQFKMQLRNIKNNK